MLKKLSMKNEGFTIIEVLIVLAIAGLIMLVVFLAVPSLQRNQRNTQYRNEASRLLGAYNEISANNAGSVLTSTDQAAVLAAANVKNISTLTIEAHSATAAVTNVNTAVIRTGAKCTGPASNATLAGSTRQVVVIFTIETSGGTTSQCQEA